VDNNPTGPVAPSGREPSPGARIAVIGDVAGHLDELRTELRRLGADPTTGVLPADLTVVQVGDLVHRGPASDDVVALVDRYLTDQPGQWIQLVGNHEAQYLRAPVFEWPQRLAPKAAATLRRWWAGGQMRVATSVRDGTESYLITHAGLTAGFWRSDLCAPQDAEQAAAALNALISTDENAVFRAGTMLLGRRCAGSAGPAWAAASAELLPSWRAERLPFSQIHGHDSLFDWRRGRFPTASAELAERTVLDREAKHESTTLAGGRIIGIDPGHGAEPSSPWRAWVAGAGALPPST
jgi:hypothetical protein